MEIGNDKPVEAKSLIKRKFLSFPLAYWSAVIVIIISIDYNDGVQRLSNYNFAEAIVVDKVLLTPPGGTRRTPDVEYAQWQYKTSQGVFLGANNTNNAPIAARTAGIARVAKPRPPCVIIVGH